MERQTEDTKPIKSWKKMEHQIKGIKKIS